MNKRAWEEMLTFESELYTMLTVFTDTEVGVAAKIMLTDGQKTKTSVAVGRRPITFFLETDTMYTLRALETDISIAYLHGGEGLAERGIRYLQSSKQAYDLHYAPPTGWVGGPTTLIRHSGMHHAFFLWNPLGENPETLYWGHAAGESLTRLRSMPIAAMPPEELQLSRYRCGGAIGGTAVECGERVKILFTRCILDKTMHLISTGLMEMSSRDMLYFSEAESLETDLQGYCPNVIGDLLFTCGSLHGKGAVYAYGKEDGVWKKQGILLKDPHTPYLHCVDFFPVGRTHAVLTEGKDGIARWIIGTYTDGKFRKREEGILDIGAFHMPCTVLNGAERILLGSIGYKAFSLPREVYTKRGRLLTRPAKEIYTYFSAEGKGAACYTCLRGSREEDVSVQIGPVRLIKEGARLQVETGADTREFLVQAEKAELFIDRDIAELFVNDGELVYSFLVQNEGNVMLHEKRGNWQSMVHYFSEQKPFEA